jgi:hypothetical protein
VVGGGEVGAKQGVRVMVSVSNVVDAFRANTRPNTVTPVVTWMDVKAMIVP